MICFYQQVLTQYRYIRPFPGHFARKMQSLSEKALAEYEKAGEETTEAEVNGMLIFLISKMKQDVNKKLHLLRKKNIRNLFL